MIRSDGYNECYTPTLFKRQRNPLLAKVEKNKKQASKENWLKIRSKLFFKKDTNGAPTAASDQNIDPEDVGFLQNKDHLGTNTIAAQFYRYLFFWLTPFFDTLISIR